MQIGCDPKADSTITLRHGQQLTTVLELVRSGNLNPKLEDMVLEGYGGVLCVEAGGPTPGLGCAGRGIIAALEKLEAAGAVHKVNTEEGALYQYCGRQSQGHRDCFLLKCERCGRIRHVDCTRLQNLYDHLEREHHFRIDPRGTLFSGVCDVCAGEEDHHGAQ